MTRTRYGVSPWLDAFPTKKRPDFPRFRGEAALPVVIVGGGLTGVFSAYAFAAAGVRVALVEANRLGHAGAARGPGILHAEAAASYRDVEARHGRKVARTMFSASRRAVLDLAAAARRLGVNDVSVLNGWRVLASYDADERALAREAALRREAGLDAVWVKPAAAKRELGVESGRAALRLHDWGVADPYRLVAAFAAAAVERGAQVFERTAVRRVKVRRAGVELETDAGRVTAETVVVCTGEPTDLYRPLKRHVHTTERYCVVTERVPAAVRRQLPAAPAVVTDTEAPAHLLRWMEDGRFVIAGADQARTSERTKARVVVQRTGQLMYELSRLYPAISGVAAAYGWDLADATSADGVMYAGPHRNYPHHLFGWATRHDPAHAFLASRILLRHHLGESTKDDACFAFTRG